MKLVVELNGTDANPYHRLGFSQNPFPQTAKAEYDRHCLHLQALGGDPIPDVEYIRKHLQGWDARFVNLCCDQFRKGEIVKFELHWPEVE